MSKRFLAHLPRLLLCGLVLSGPSFAQSEEPEKPLSWVADHLQHVMDITLHGFECRPALVPWKPGERLEESEALLRQKSVRHKFSGTRCIGFEWNLEFVRGGKVVYVLDTVVTPDKKGLRFLSVAGRTPTDDTPRFTPLAQCKEGSEAFKLATEELLESMRKKETPLFPLVGQAVLKQLASPSLIREWTTERSQPSTELARKAEAVLDSLKFDKVRIGLGRVWYTPIAGRSSVDGWISSRLRLRADGQVVYQLDGFVAEGDKK